MQLAQLASQFWHVGFVEPAHTPERYWLALHELVHAAHCVSDVLVHAAVTYCCALQAFLQLVHWRLVEVVQGPDWYCEAEHVVHVVHVMSCVALHAAVWYEPLGHDVEHGVQYGVVYVEQTPARY